MHDIHIKKVTHKVDPSHPQSTDPTWEKAYLKGQAKLRAGKFKLENEADQRDYERAITSNPGNVPGMPAFFPPLEMRSVGGLPSDCKNGHHRPIKCGDGSFCSECQIDL